MREIVLRRTSFRYVNMSDKFALFVTVDGDPIMSLVIDKGVSAAA